MKPLDLTEPGISRAPQSQTRNKITPASGVQALTLKANGANIQEWMNASDTVVASISSVGAALLASATISNLAGTGVRLTTSTAAGLQGNATAIAGNYDFAGTMTFGVYTGQTSIVTLGTITAGTWQGTSISTTYTDAKIKTVTGTANRLSIGGTSTDPTFDISAAYVGQATITTLGTITAGTWQGTSIATTYTDAKVKTVTGTASRLTIGGTSTDPTFDISTSYVGQATITTLGTITTGTWSATAIGPTKGGTGLTAYTTGDLLYASATNVLSRLAIGTDGYVLTLASGVPTWAASSSTAGNPTASVGLAAVNGVASTYMRSDAAPPISQSIAPTWTGVHLFSLPDNTAIAWEALQGTDVYIKIKTTDSAESIVFGNATTNPLFTFLGTGLATFAGAVTVTGALTGTLTGNASTATALQTARTINAVSFDGTGNIIVTAAAGTLTGATLNSTVLASSLTSVGTLAALTVTATITGSITGNAGTATVLQTTRAINGVNFDGSAAITVTAAASTLTGTVLNSTVVTSSLTSVGTLTALTISGTLTSTVTTDATSTTAAGSMFAGGVSIEKKLWIGGSFTLQAGNSASEADVNVRASRGTIALPTDVGNNDANFNMAVNAYSGGTYFSTGSMSINVDGTYTSGQRPPSRFEFYTNAANTAAALALKIDSSQVATFSSNVVLSKAGDGVQLKTLIANTSNTASSDALVQVTTAGASANDPFFRMDVSGVTAFAMGLDNSVTGDPFTIAASGTLGSSNVLTLTTTGVMDLVGSAKSIRIGGTQVLQARVTGWTAATGVATRTAFATSTVSTSVLAEHVKALIDDLITHGVIGT